MYDDNMMGKIKKWSRWLLLGMMLTVVFPAFTQDTGHPRGTGLNVVTQGAGSAGTPSAGVLTIQGVSGGTNIPVSGTFWQSTQPVSGTFWQASQPVTGTFWQATQPVSGTFWQATQPVSGPITDAQLRATAVPVSGTFFQATQPISAAALPLPSGAATSALQSTINTSVGAVLKPADTLTKVTTVDTITNGVSIGSSTGKALVMKTGTLVTTATTADQIVLTYTVTSGKTFYLEYLSVTPRLTVISATASILGAWSLETPSGTKTFTQTTTNATTSLLVPLTVTFSEPLPVAAGVVVRVVTTPAATTSMTWVGNLGGYEK